MRCTLPAVWVSDDASEPKDGQGADHAQLLQVLMTRRPQLRAKADPLHLLDRLRDPSITSVMDRQERQCARSIRHVLQ